MDSQVRILRAQPRSVSAHSRILLRPPAKLNLYLTITGTYSNGYHKIESIVNRVSLCDTLRISSIGDNRVDFFCDRRSLNNEDNLCVRAALLIKKKYRIPCGFSIILNKAIPAGSGLGGASSNAAYTLTGINSLLKLRIPRKELFAMGAVLGSDVNFFINGSPWALLGGRGQVVTTLDIKRKYRYLIVYPGVTLSTRLVYAAAKAKLTKYINNVSILHYALRKKDYLLVEKLCFNSLEHAALEICEKLTKVKQFFNTRGIFCLLTGSGSAFFTILDPKKMKTSGKTLVHTLRSQGWFVYEVQTS